MPEYIKSDGDMFKPPDNSGEMPKRKSSDIGRRLAAERGKPGQKQGELSLKPKDPTESSFLGDGKEKLKNLLQRGFTTREREITPSEKIAESVKTNNTEQYREAQRTLESADQATREK